MDDLDGVRRAADRLADRWSLTTGEVMQFDNTAYGMRAGEPGATAVGDEIVGMLSVNAVSGAVWHHSWHGRFIAMDEPDGS